MAHCQKLTLFCFKFYWLWLELIDMCSINIWFSLDLDNFSHFFPVSCMYWDCNAQHMANFHFVYAYFHVAKCEWTLQRNIDTACKKVNVGQIDLPLQLKWAETIDWMWKNRYIQINMHKTQPIFEYWNRFWLVFVDIAYLKRIKRHYYFNAGQIAQCAHILAARKHETSRLFVEIIVKIIKAYTMRSNVLHVGWPIQKKCHDSRRWIYDSKQKCSWCTHANSYLSSNRVENSCNARIITRVDLLSTGLAY